MKAQKYKELLELISRDSDFQQFCQTRCRLGGQSELLQALTQLARIGVHPVSSGSLQFVAIETARSECNSGRLHSTAGQYVPYTIAYDETVAGFSFNLLRSETKEIRCWFRRLDIISRNEWAIRSVWNSREKALRLAGTTTCGYCKWNGSSLQ